MIDTNDNQEQNENLDEGKYRYPDPSMRNDLRTKCPKENDAIKVNPCKVKGFRVEKDYCRRENCLKLHESNIPLPYK